MFSKIMKKLGKNTAFIIPVKSRRRKSLYIWQNDAQYLQFVSAKYCLLLMSHNLGWNTFTDTALSHKHNMMSESLQSVLNRHKIDNWHKRTFQITTFDSLLNAKPLIKSLHAMTECQDNHPSNDYEHHTPHLHAGPRFNIKTVFQVCVFPL